MDFTFPSEGWKHPCRPGGLARLACSFFLTAIAGCTAPLNGAYLRHDAQIDLATLSLSVCHGYGCVYRSRISFADVWTELVGMFHHPAETPEKERDVLAAAIGRMRLIAGKRSGTASNAPGSYPIMFDDPTQMDCVDEASNTYVYLTLLSASGVFRFHTIGAPVARGSVFILTAHNAATIVEKQTGKRYAVDPWLSEMGEKAAVVPVEQWHKL